MYNIRCSRKIAKKENDLTPCKENCTHVFRDKLLGIRVGIELKASSQAKRVILSSSSSCCLLLLLLSYTSPFCIPRADCEVECV